MISNSSQAVCSTSGPAANPIDTGIAQGLAQLTSGADVLAQFIIVVALLHVKKGLMLSHIATVGVEEE